MFSCPILIDSAFKVAGYDAHVGWVWNVFMPHAISVLSWLQTKMLSLFHFYNIVNSYSGRFVVWTAGHESARITGFIDCNKRESARRSILFRFVSICSAFRQDVGAGAPGGGALHGREVAVEEVEEAVHFRAAVTAACRQVKR